jgi:hypothetical protein
LDTFSLAKNFTWIPACAGMTLRVEGGFAPLTPFPLFNFCLKLVEKT